MPWAERDALCMAALEVSGIKIGAFLDTASHINIKDARDVRFLFLKFCLCTMLVALKKKQQQITGMY